MSRRRVRNGLGAGLAIGLGLVLAAPAAAQFVDGYRFLEAVRKKDGDTVTDALALPGSTLVNARDVTTGDSALHIVVQRRDLTWIRFLHSRGANVNLRNNKGETPLVIASNLGFTEGVEALVGLGARVDEASATGETPLIAATHRRDPAMARVLLKAGADPRHSDNSGRSAFEYAQFDGRGNPVLAEIESALSKKKTTDARPSYGPSL